MITYLVKTLLCAALLFLIYFLFLEREKMYRFNRFYLLFSIVFSFGVSFITIESKSPVVSVSEMITPIVVPGTEKPAANIQQAAVPVPVKESIPWPNILLGLYVAGTAFFMIRFTHNITILLTKAFHNKRIEYQGAKLVLAKDTTLPFSFLKYIFIDKEKFEKGSIEKEILQHELTHVNQKHSLDVLLVELITVFAWINPILFLFHKAIVLNHEYLADEAVVNTFNDTENYRQLLFSKVCQSNNLVLSSSFNYLTTKKRFTMMTKKTSQKVAILKQIALIPMIAVIGFLFSTRVIAQDNTKQSSTQKQPLFSKTDAPQSVIDEYHALLEKYNLKLVKTSPKKDTTSNNPNAKKPLEWAVVTKGVDFHINTTDRTRMEQLYFQMSYKQQAHEFFIFYPKPELKTKIVPTKEQLESWKNPKIYGIWFSGAKRQKNSVLNNYANTDFYNYELRKLDEKSAKIMKYQIEVGLMTKEQFEKYNAIQAGRWKINPEDKYEMVCRIYSEKELAKIDAGK